MPTLPLLETTWKTWKAMGFEETMVMQPAPGETYASYPYGEYRTVNEYILFPVSVQDDRIPAKERVLVMPNQKQEASAFRYQDMANVNYLANYDDFTLVAFPDQDLMVGFLPEYQDGSAAEFSRIEGEFPVILEDQEGNRWDVFGRALSGPRTGQTLTRVTTTMAYFFCLSSVYDQLEIYGNYKPLDGG